MKINYKKEKLGFIQQNIRSIVVATLVCQSRFNCMLLAEQQQQSGFFCMTEHNNQEFCEQYDNNPCIATEPLSENGKQYAIVNCSYKETNKHNQIEYVFRKHLIHANPYGRHVQNHTN